MRAVGVDDELEPLALHRARSRATSPPVRRHERERLGPADGHATSDPDRLDAVGGRNRVQPRRNASRHGEPRRDSPRLRAARGEADGAWESATHPRLDRCRVQAIPRRRALPAAAVASPNRTRTSRRNLPRERLQDVSAVPRGEACPPRSRNNHESAPAGRPARNGSRSRGERIALSDLVPHLVPTPADAV